jgi:hypothetical protein
MDIPRAFRSACAALVALLAIAPLAAQASPGPETTITVAPEGVIPTNTAFFRFESSVSGSTFQCAMDSGSFGACSSPRTYPGLSEGPHTFSVYAIDPDGFADETPAAQSFSVDTTPPEITILKPIPGVYLNDELIVGTAGFPVVKGPITFEVRVLDPQSGISFFEFQIDNLAVDASKVSYSYDPDTHVYVYRTTYRTFFGGAHSFVALARNGARPSPTAEGTPAFAQVRVIIVPGG